MDKKQELPPISLEKFDEEVKKLQEVYNNNCADLTRVFLEKTEHLFERLTEEDKAVALRREVDRIHGQVQQESGIVDLSGRRMTVH